MTTEVTTPEATKPDTRDAVIADLRRQLSDRDAMVRQLAQQQQTLLSERMSLHSALSGARADVARWKLAAGVSGVLSFLAGRVMR